MFQTVVDEWREIKRLRFAWTKRSTGPTHEVHGVIDHAFRADRTGSLHPDSGTIRHGLFRRRIDLDPETPLLRRIGSIVRMNAHTREDDARRLFHGGC